MPGHIYTKLVCREAFLISPTATYCTMCPNHEFREVAEQQSNRGTPITCLRSEKDANLKKHLRIHIETTVDADLKKTNSTVTYSLEILTLRLNSSEVSSRGDVGSLCVCYL